MDKETLSNYGWIVICVLVMVVMIALAGPFGNFVSEAVKSTTQGLFDVNQNALDAAGIAINDNAFVEGNGGAGQTPETPQGNIIPNGGTYYVGVTSVNTGDYTGATATYTSGQEFPTTVNDGDVYVYGDYEYRYNYYFNTSKWYSAAQNGWGVRVLDMGKSSYGEILGTINGKPLTALSHTFLSCNALVTAPTIPDSVTKMGYTFDGCCALATYVGSTDSNGDFSGYVIPNGVTDMSNAFTNCYPLTTSPVIPSSVTYLNSTFSGCVNLTTAPIIPSSVTNLVQTFQNCAALKTYVGSADPDGDFSGYVIPSSVTNMCGTFKGCKSLVNAPVIPSSVTYMKYTFEYCTALTTAPEIPSSVTNMNSIFKGCTALTGTIEINANPLESFSCFENTTQPIVLTGRSSMLDTIAATGNNGNVTVEVYTEPEVPGTEALDVGTYTAKDGTVYESGDTLPALTVGDTYICGDYKYKYQSSGWHVVVLDKTKTTYGEILSEINGGAVTSINGTFQNCTALTTAPAIPSSITSMNVTFAGCKALTGTITIDANPSSYVLCFSGTKNPIALTGSSTVLAEIAATGNGNVTVE